MRGVRMNIVDDVLYGDAIHRGASQIFPTVRRLSLACELTAEPRLQEPIFNTEITAPQDAMGSIYSCLTQRRAAIKDSLFEANSKSAAIVFAIRKRKGLKEGIPDINKFLDKL
ncbi:hypothetical protein ABPG72_015054 [Tetrahymena utriculariae]